MNKELDNFTFIDAQNLYMAISELNWKIDYLKLRVYLKEKYGVKRAYIFMGYKKSEKKLYEFFNEVGYLTIFKPILELKNGKIKGNCDAELVLQSMIDFNNFKKAIIITGDGDFYCLIKYFIEENKLLKVISPTPKNCSSLITNILKGDISMISDLRNKIEFIRKMPSVDKTTKDKFHS